MKKFIVLFATVALICAFSMPAAAMEEKTSEERIEALEAGAGGWKLYGSARMGTFWDDMGTDEGTTWDMQGNSRLGASVSHGAIGGGFEFAVNDGTGGDSGNVGTRKLYGTYNFGAGQLLIGQTYAPTASSFYSNQVWGGDTDLLNTGQLYTSRRPMIQFSSQGFKLALIKPNAGGTLVVPDIGGGDPVEVDVDATLPKIEIGYGGKFGPAALNFSAGYQTIDTEGAIEESFDAYVTELGAVFGAGPATISFAVNYMVNGGLYGVWSAIDQAAVFDGAVQDATAMGGLLVANFKANDMLSFEVGAGYRETEVDVAGVTTEDEVISYYANSVVKIAPNFFIVPEVGILDIDSYDDETLYFGAKWQINW